MITPVGRYSNAMGSFPSNGLEKPSDINTSNAPSEEMNMISFFNRKLHWWPPIVLFIGASYYFSPFLGQGLPLFFDAHSHVARSWMAYRLFQNASFSDWSYTWYGGYRFTEFYGGLYYYLSGFLAQFTGDVVLTTKVLVWALQVFSVLACYYCLRSLNISFIASLIGASIFIKTPIFEWVVGTLGNYPSLLLVLCLPLLAANTNQYIKLKNSILESQLSFDLKFAGLNALLMAIMAASHFANCLVMLPAILALQTLMMGFELKRISSRMLAWRALFASYMFAVVLTAYVWLPYFLHIDNATLGLLKLLPYRTTLDITPVLRVFSLADFNWHFPFVRGHSMVLVWVAVLMGILGLVKRFRRALPFAVALFAALFSLSLLSDRAVIVVPFLLVVLFSFALDAFFYLIFKVVRHYSWHFKVLIALFIWLVTGVTLRAVPHYESSDTMRIYEAIPRTPLMGRSFDVTKSPLSLDGFYGASSVSPFYSGRSIVFGAFPQGAPINTNISMALTSYLVGMRSDNPNFCSDEVMSILFLDFVEFLVQRDDAIGFCAVDSGEYGKIVSASVFQLNQVTPIIFSQKISKLPDLNVGMKVKPVLNSLIDRWRSDIPTKDAVSDSAARLLMRTRGKDDWSLVLPYVKKMHLDRKEMIADRFFVADNQEHIASDLSAKLNFSLISHREQDQRVDIEAEATVGGFARISYAYDPAIRVYLDGMQVKALQDALGNAFIIDFPEGRHKVTVLPPKDVVENIMKFISVIGVLLLIMQGLNGTYLSQRRFLRSA